MQLITKYVINCISIVFKFNICYTIIVKENIICN